MFRSARTAFCAALGIALSVFICHKQVMAAPILRVSNERAYVVIDLGGTEHVVETPAGFFARGVPAAGDYLIIYEPDGYMSWSPKAVFEAGYHAATDGMSFGDALDALKAGHRVARAGWNGKGLWLELQVPDAHSKMSLPYAFLNYPPDAMNTPGARVPWVCSQTDMLADDWVIVG